MMRRFYIERRGYPLVEDNADFISDMRPRSRLLAKRRLPTIREGYEELLQDMNQANSYHAPHHTRQDALSSEDYLRSICQLAQPTFPLQEPDRDILTLGPLEALKPSLRLARLSAPTRPSTPTVCSHLEEQMRDKVGLRNFSDITVPDAVRQNHGRDGCHSAPDPLEYLYGHLGTPASSTCLSRDTKGRLSEGGVSREVGDRLGSHSLPRANSFPLLCSPRQAYRKSSCPEIILEDMPPSPAPSPPRPCPPKEKKSSTTRLPNQRPQEGMGSHATTGERENCGGSTDKHSIISNWIADCRSAGMTPKERVMYMLYGKDSTRKDVLL
ncbi:hypothetical protein AAFF_G00319700 [Aldrovandia affinis]|uniref:Uncharacterized protein n=1 Tax=Aldrovandia affinis TaxID=143900 RepID=A0AAD7SMN0_9TELE|nr:hypothetical protein AAFF_G00319700 [Aldrovandia affinis]